MHTLWREAGSDACPSRSGSSNTIAFLIMRLVRLRHSDGNAYFAEVLDEATARLWSAPPWNGGEPTRRLVPLARSRLLPPVAPSKVVALGRTYSAHAREMGGEPPEEPVLFLKAPSTLIPHGAPILLPPESERVEAEGEIGLVVGRRLRRASPEEAERAIAAVTCVVDVTARDLQRRDVQFTRAKSFDSFCPVGPHLQTDFDLSDIGLVTRVDGTERQRANLNEMSWSPAALLAWVSHVMRLEPGDLVCTGTPAGVPRIQAGMVVEVEARGIGTLRNPVEVERLPPEVLPSSQVLHL